jgi:hypothetical protein
MQTQTNNAKNEHDIKIQFIYFVSKYLVCKFSTFATKCVNH